MEDVLYDLAIIGGGINGCGIARDAAGRGLKVYLCEQGDLGGATSSASTKLLHGGLRYLEHYEFRLVREALIEREVLWRIAPHIVRPLRFVLPYTKGMRRAWLLRLGLFLYDHLGGRKLLPGTARVDFARSAVGQGLRAGLDFGYEYSDCWVEDNRLVILNARDAEERGAVIATGTRCTHAAADAAGGWRVITEALATGVKTSLRARVLVNAAGPWANEVAQSLVGRPPKGKVRLVQGSHLVVPKLYDHDRCFIFQNADGRIVFTIPYEGKFTLIGTTDRDYQGDLAQVRASEAETAYLCAAVSEYFRKPVTPLDVVWSYSGVRPLYDDGQTKAQQATRDYVLEVDTAINAPMLSVFGGKITTYRRLAESAMDKLLPLLPAGSGTKAEAKGWTGRKPLPGGEFQPQDLNMQVNALVKTYGFLTRDEAHRLIRLYGTRARRMLGEARARADLGRDFGGGLTAREIDYLRTYEWVRCAEDILFRRSKLGLHISPAEAAAIDDYLQHSSQTRADMAAQ